MLVVESFLTLVSLAAFFLDSVTAFTKTLGGMWLFRLSHRVLSNWHLHRRRVILEIYLISSRGLGPFWILLLPLLVLRLILYFQSLFDQHLFSVVKFNVIDRVSAVRSIFVRLNLGKRIYDFLWVCRSSRIQIILHLFYYISYYCSYWFH